VVIMEAELTMELREWYMKAAKQFGWSKIELLTNIKVNKFESFVVDATEEVQCIITGEKESSKPEPESMESINITTCLVVWIE